jgi:NAD(P)-dependent dehydrogenase (short-subunit alcohol dehydrogenase family)
MMKKILITGGAKRIGESIAKSLADDGHTILIHYNNSENEAKKLQNHIRNKQVASSIYKSNLENEEDIETLLEKIKIDYGDELDTIINCASTFENDSARNFNSKTFDKHIKTNLLAPIILSKYLSNNCNKSRDNNIINIIDQRVLRLNPSYFSYSISKYGLYGATKMMAQEYSPHIRVNGIAPGPIIANIDQSQSDFDKEASNTPLGQKPDINDISNAIKFILSTKSVTGQVIAIDSGQHISWETPDFVPARKIDF